LRLARDANAAASRLAEGLRALPGVRLNHPVDANMIFADLPMPAHRRARAEGAQYYLMPAGQAEDGPDDAHVGARLVTSWCTTAQDVDAFLAALRG
jgi:threonine aldolase